MRTDVVSSSPLGRSECLIRSLPGRARRNTYHGPRSLCCRSTAKLRSTGATEEARVRWLTTKCRPRSGHRSSTSTCSPPPPATAQTLRGGRFAKQCPVAWTERNGGHWIVSGYEEVATAFRDWEHFSSARTNPKYCAITLGDSLLPLLTPEEIDPPDWYPLRRILAELLSPKASERLRPLRRALGGALHRRGHRVREMRVRLRPRVPGSRGGHARVAGLPAERLARVLCRLPRHRRVLEGQPRVRAGERGVPAGARTDPRRARGPAGASHATTP